MERKGSFDHVKALVSSIHGSFPSSILVDDNVLATSFPTGGDQSRGSAPMTPTRATPNRATETASPTPADSGGTGTESGNVSPSKMPHRLRIPSLVVTNALTPYLLSSNPGTGGTGEGDHSLRRFSFALMRRHSNTVPKTTTKSSRSLFLSLVKPSWDCWTWPALCPAVFGWFDWSSLRSANAN